MPRLAPPSRGRRSRRRLPSPRPRTPTPTIAEPAPGPVRTCVGCRRPAPQVELTRIGRSLDGGLQVSPTAPGRGAWLCTGQVDCFDRAARRRGFDRAFRTSVSREAVAELRRQLFGNHQQNLRDLPVAGLWPGDGTRPTKG